MTSIIESVEIARPPEDVFAYLDKLDRHGEWQEEIVSAKVDTEGPVRVGTRVTEVRKVPGGKRPITYEITAHDPPRTSSFRGTNGPIRVVGTVTVEPAGEGRSRVTIDLDFEGHGFGKVLVPLVRRDARKRVPANQAKLKARLEAGA
jgi:uncharacterized protein YndB with AHSA1/START domain